LERRPLEEDRKYKEKTQLKHKKQKLSYVDCLGYVSAKEKGLIFLTGDIQFRDISNVEFVE
jgi:predicted nucleic acid-binding protein